MEYILPALSTLLTLLLLPVVGYFLKRIHEKVEASAGDINAININMAGMGAEFSKNTTAAFNELCKERQGHCHASQLLRFKSLETSDGINCNKIHRLEDERKEAWVIQKVWNTKIEAFISGIKEDRKKKD